VLVFYVVNRAEKLMSVKKTFVPPAAVRRNAKLGLKLHKSGFKGGTQTGWNRARQLAEKESISLSTLATMRAWFARHGPDAANNGTSYPGYRKWIEDGSPTVPDNSNRDAYRGAVSWLIWGGDAAYKWLKSDKVRTALQQTYPNRKSASPRNNLVK